jgi:glycosyltransferase involved in cell wall biosynthesis
VSDRPRVLRLITRLNVGGPARQALLLTRALAPDFDTQLAAGRPEAAEGELTDPEVAVAHVPLVRSPNPWLDTRAVLETRRLLRSRRTHVLHTHMSKAGTVGRVAARLVSPRPVTIHTFHGHVLEGYFSPPVRRIFLEVERRLAPRTDVLVTISEEIRDALLDLGIGRPEQFRVIRLGFDLSAFSAVTVPRGVLRKSLRLAPDVPLVGIVGRLVPIKDVPTMLHAMHEVPQAHLAVIGDGELRPELEAAAQAAGLADRVHFTGWAPDVAAALSDLDVVALSSRNEGTPVALIEAIAAGRPVVATDVGGVRAVVRDGETGFLVPPNDAVALGAAVRRLLEDPDLRRRMGAAGRAAVIERFGQDRLVREVGDLYRELLAGRRPRLSP